MKIVSSITKHVYDLDFKKSGENMLPCPECNDSRKHKGKKSFSFNATQKVGFCQNCQAKFYEYKPFKEQKQYQVPVWKNITQLTERAVKWFNDRMISQATLAKMKVYSDHEFMPQTGQQESVICFPYFLDANLVNIKYRDGRKNFKLYKDAELVFFNINVLKEVKEIVIVEGEIDALSYIEAGISNVVSVPNGAGKNLEYLDNHIELFDPLEKIYIATDNDIKGIELREELIRRLGQERCLIVLFNDCKDANEYLVKNGGIALANTLKTAFEIPVSGIVNLGNYYDDIYSMFIHGLEKGKGIGNELDNLVTWELGRLAVVTGIPGHGKSEYVDFICVLLNVMHSWKVAYFSPENYPIKYHFAKIASKVSGKQFKQGYMQQDEFESVYEYIQDNFFFIYPEDDMSFDNILTKAKYLVKKYGIKIFVIDPYNKIEHMRASSESETEYISKLLDRISAFAKQFNVLVFLVAHPRKMDKNNQGFYNVPNLYDINGSANFYNKSDYGMTVYRDFVNKVVQIHVIKVKFKHLGDGGTINLHYNYVNGRYEPENATVDRWNQTNYLVKSEPTPVQQLPINTNFETQEQWPDEPPF